MLLGNRIRVLSILSLSLLGIFLSGCIQVTIERKIKLIEGVFVTPIKEIRFKRDQGEDHKVFYGADHNSEFKIVAQGQEEAVIVDPRTFTDIVKLVTNENNRVFQYEQGSGRFKISENLTVPIILYDAHLNHERSIDNVLVVKIAGVLGKRGLENSRMLRLRLDSKRSKMYSPKFNDIVHMRLPFTIDGAEYLIDVTYSYVKNRKISFISMH